MPHPVMKSEFIVVQAVPFTAALLATLAVIAAQPLALIVQSRITTSGQPGNLTITQVTRQEQGKMVIHRIQTQG